MSNRVKVHLFGSEDIGWALDTDLALTKKSLELLSDQIELTSLKDAEVIHSVWEEPLFQLEQKEIAGKRIICHACNDIMRLYENPHMIRAKDTIGLWIAMSQAAISDFESLQFPYAHIPYSVDTQIFSPSNSENTAKQHIRSIKGIPDEPFVISNFMRDSFGHDLCLPKDQKGVELLVEIGRRLMDKKLSIHFLLAGPRRHWVRTQLEQLGIAYTFIGEKVDGDDIDQNILSAEQISDLYRASDLHLITSRWEGGPRSVLEAASSKTPILCTHVGTAPDILDDRSLYRSIDEAVEKVEKQITTQYLNDVLDRHYQVIHENHTVESNAVQYRKLYDKIEEVPPYSLANRWVEKPVLKPSIIRRVIKLASTFTRSTGDRTNLCISLWHEFHKPPYGGGNQFMMALKDAMERQGVNVVNNKLSRSVDAHICNSCWFDFKKFENKAGDYPVRMIHRIDGPVTLYRGEGKSEDEKIFSLNQQFATATVFQSAYCFKKSYELGFKAVSPVIISNSVNNTIFNSEARQDFQGERKTRLITSAWSDNPRKGGAFLKWLDEHIDWNRFEYTFIGRVKEQFQNIKHIQPVPSEKLAHVLKQHDIYVSVSLHEPCSNALIEALSSGLPALYRDDGGNPELVSFGGLPFKGEEDVIYKLDRLAENISSFRRLIYVRSIDDIANRYIALAQKVSDWSAVI